MGEHARNLANNRERPGAETQRQTWKAPGKHTRENRKDSQRSTKNNMEKLHARRTTQSPTVRIHGNKERIRPYKTRMQPHATKTTTSPRPQKTHVVHQTQSQNNIRGRKLKNEIESGKDVNGTLDRRGDNWSAHTESIQPDYQPNTGTNSSAAWTKT